MRLCFSNAISVSAFLLTLPGIAQVQVTTNRYNNARTGADLNEVTLNPSNVNVSGFGKLFSYPVSGQIYAQPLYLANVTIPGKGTHNVVYICTMNDVVYAFDADSNNPPAGGLLWTVDITHGAPGVTPVPTTDIIDFPAGVQGNIGIMSTPVIDPATQTMYLLARTKETGAFVQRLHALDVTTGAEKFSGPVAIVANVRGTGDGSSGGTLAFDPKLHLQRPALALVQGKIAIAWGALEDQDPYHGWAMFYDARTLQQTGVYVTTPNSSRGAIWQSGRAPVVDDVNGFVYFASANGTWNGTDAMSDSLIKISASTAAQVDYFTPVDQQSDAINDLDWGSSGPMMIPGRNLLVEGNKTGVFYLLNSNNLGKLQAGNSGAVQTMQAAPYRTMSGPVYWDQSGTGILYHWGEGDDMRAFRFNGQTFDTTPLMSGLQTVTGLGANLTLSANGATPGTGIIWSNMPTTLDPGKIIVPGILRAFDAGNIANELWNSEQNVARDGIGNLAKFNTAVVANSKVYLPTFSNQLAVYGLIPSSPRPTAVPQSVTPSGGAGMRQTFVAQFQDLNGAADLQAVYLDFATVAGSANTCFVVYVQGSNKLYLFSDANSSTLGPVTPGSSQSVSNSQCTLSGSGGTVTATGTTLTVPLAITFASAFSASKTIYGLAQGYTGSNPGWQSLGTWTPGLGALSVFPDSGFGLNQTFTAAYSDSKGAGDLQVVYFEIGMGLGQAHSCFAAYVRASNALYLFNDANSSLFGPITPGSSGSISNSQCTLSGAGGPVTSSGNTLTVPFNITFLTGFTGPMSLFGLAQSYGGAQGGGAVLGTWTPSGSTALGALSVSPSSGSGLSSSFTAVYTDPSGAADLQVLYLDIGGAGAQHSCFVAYIPASNVLYLFNDTNSTVLGPITPGTSTSVSNSQCTLSGAGGPAVSGGNNLSIPFAITFASSFNGSRGIYGVAQNYSGSQGSGWRQLGSWTPAP